MIAHSKKCIRALLTIAIVLMPSLGLTQEQTPEDQAPAAKQVLPATAPDLADIVPLAAKLSGRLADLEKKLMQRRLRV
jgi:hypothetical protein